MKTTGSKDRNSAPPGGKSGDKKMTNEKASAGSKKSTSKSESNSKN